MAEEAPDLGPIQFDPKATWTEEEKALIRERLSGGGGGAPGAGGGAKGDIEQARQEYSQQVKDSVAEQKAFNQRVQEMLRRQREERKPEYEALEKEREAVDRAAAPPKLEAYPQAPKLQEMLQPTSLQKTLGMASIFALMSIGLAKGNAIYGLKALGGFMEGAHAGQTERAEAALKEFNAQMERVHRANAEALQVYNSVMTNKRWSYEQKEQMLRMKFLEHQDELSAATLEQQGMNAVHSRLSDLAKMNNQWGMELLRYKQIERQMAHDRAMEARRTATDKAALKQSDIARIETEARQQVSAALPRDQLGNIMLGPEWGSTMQERITKFEKFVDQRKRKIAADRGLSGLFDKAPSEEDPEMALRHAVNTGEVKKDTKAAMDFLEKRGVTGAQAARIIQKVANEPYSQY